MNRIITLLALAALPLAAPLSAASSKKAKDGSIALPLKQIIPAPQRVCTMKTESGLGYRVLRAGTGPMPRRGSTPLINYIGYLAVDGVVFDQNVGVPMPVDGVIPGFAEALRMTPQGGITRFCIPARLGYGDRATGPIPAGSDLIFQLEVVKAE